MPAECDTLEGRMEWKALALLIEGVGEYVEIMPGTAT
jgi:hypothetical protein